MRSDKNLFKKDAIWLCKNLSRILEKQFVLYPLLYAEMKSDKNLFEKNAIWLCKNLSWILERQLKILTALSFPISVLSLFLNIGLTEAILAESKNEFIKRSLLTMLVRYLMIM